MPDNALPKKRLLKPELSDKEIPELLCGPFLRKVDKTQAIIWFVTSVQDDYRVIFKQANHKIDFSQTAQTIAIGRHCFINQIHCKTNIIEHKQSHWPLDEQISYQLEKTVSNQNNGKKQKLDLTAVSLKQQTTPAFIVKDKLTSVIQGSCRKPDHPAPDAFATIGKQLNEGTLPRPDYLIMAGDQIYADDVAAPMLVACQLLSKRLGLYSATHEIGAVSKQQLDWRYSLFKRSSLFPKKQNQSRFAKLWHGDNIISARHHENHLIGLDEFFACYLLTWSSKCWGLVYPQTQEAQQQLNQNQQQIYQKELTHLNGFIDSLPLFEKTVANIPTVMIFDDHDITDDWNLTADWEEHIYGNTVTNNMIRDGLLSYTLFQGWGNCPEKVENLIEQISLLSQNKDFASEVFTEVIHQHNQWHYSIKTEPAIVVLDTRTHRWRSETSNKNPSGLMDWERLEQFEKHLFKPQNSVLVVSAAPVFGVKAIEVIQSGCEMIGKELLVDVENWMAHQGSAKKLMEMLRHDSAPDEVIILSGDVHYSFCFSAMRRFSSDTDKIWQLTCSGFKNEFPQKLLRFFDFIDRFLYSNHSILNLFTKRRKMEIEHHPLLSKKGRHERHLHSQSAAGLVTLNDKGLLAEYRLISGVGESHVFDISDQ